MTLLITFPMTCLLSAAPSIVIVDINGGEAHRSHLTSISLTFSEDVGATLQAGDLIFNNTTTNTTVTGALLTYTSSTKTGTWTFPAAVGGSLPDGNYNIFISPADVTANDGSQLTPSAGQTVWSTKLFRYFGDSDGDRDVDQLDTYRFRQAFGTSKGNAAFSPAFDSDGNGKLDDIDAEAFRANYISVLRNPDAPDRDADGLPDEFETFNGLNPASPAEGALDYDNDGLSNAQEKELGTFFDRPDSNGDGILDNIARESGWSAISNDTDGDGLSNRAELAAGTSPIHSDTDRDGVPDGTDPFPLDPTRNSLPPIAGDATPPTITLLIPKSAVLQP